MMKLMELNERNWSDIMITDFTNPLFQAAFRQYFSDMGICVEDWNAVFEEMNEDGDNAAFIRTASSDFFNSGRLSFQAGFLKKPAVLSGSSGLPGITERMATAPRLFVLPKSISWTTESIQVF